MDLLYYILGALGLGLVGMALVPPGPAILAGGYALLRDSRLAQGAALMLIGILTLLWVRTAGRKEGHAEAFREVEVANRQAVEKRKRVDDAVARRTDSQVRDELKRWSR